MKSRLTIILAAIALPFSAFAVDSYISNLPAKPSPSPADYIGVVDAALHTANPNNQNGVKVTLGQLAIFFGATGMVDSEQTIGDANGAWTATNHVLRQSAALTTNRTSAMPLAAAYKKGDRVLYLDAISSTTSAFGRTFTASGSDTINGSGSYLPFTGFGSVELESDGISAWQSFGNRAVITTLQDGTDPSKQGQFDLSGVSAASTRSGAWPDYNFPLGTRLKFFVSNITVLTSGSPSDIATITLPSGLLKWRPYGTTVATAVSVMIGRASAGDMSAATFQGWTGAGGTGTQIFSNSTGPTGVGVMGSLTAQTGAISTASTLIIRQTVNSGNAGTVDLYVELIPIQ